MFQNINLELLLDNMKKGRIYKEQTKRLGKSTKSIMFQKAITDLNNNLGTKYYLERDDHSFTIQGHREYGHVSITGYELGDNIGFTLGLREIEHIDMFTIKMVVDKNNNYILVNLTTMKDLGQFSSEKLKEKFFRNRDKTVYYYHWTLKELIEMNALMYKSGGINA